MRYLFLLYSDPQNGPAPGSPEEAAEMPAWFDYTQKLADAGVLLGGEALHPVESATTVRVRDDKALHTDGPFAETKETLGGFYMIDVETLDEALDWAAKIPNVGYGSVEVRPIMELPEQ
jgi:hypothetical protein